MTPHQLATDLSLDPTVLATCTALSDKINASKNPLLTCACGWQGRGGDCSVRRTKEGLFGICPQCGASEDDMGAEA